MTQPERIALLIQYIGTDFNGWQRQPHVRTVQAEIELAIAQFLQHPITIHGAGRTDTGVHAAGQVAHFEATTKVPGDRWPAIINSRLKGDILIRASNTVPPDWHAQFDANWRRYRYTLYTDKIANLFIDRFSWHYYHTPLDEDLMQQALNPLIGEHDLAAFQRANSTRPHSRVKIMEANCWRQDSFIYMEIQANGFLYGMVRLLMGTLIYVGTKEITVNKFTKLWQQGQRDQIKYAAPAKGLCLLQVDYPINPFPSNICYNAQPQFLLS